MKKLLVIIMSFVLCTAILCSCAPADADNKEVQAETQAAGETVRELLSTMTLEEKVWQMFFVTPEDIIDIGAAVQAGEATKQALESYPVGGIIYFGKNIEDYDQLKTMISNTQSYSKIPLFISVDEEGGRVSRLGSAGIIDKKPPMAEIGKMGEEGIADAESMGEFLGEELSALGFNMDFAPVADVITVENNEDIGDRSFGADPNLVAKMVAAEVKGMQSKNVSSTLKHFPSNGSTAANTHEGAGISERTADEMRKCEFIPFKAGIDAGADLVMVAHMAAVNLAGGEIPSTLSRVIIQDYLRGELGFSKVVISDALNMGAITDMYTPSEAAVEAVKAGVDLLLMSPDVKTVAQAVIDSVRSGEISEKSIDESVTRILELKTERGIIR